MPTSWHGSLMLCLEFTCSCSTERITQALFQAHFAALTAAAAAAASAPDSSCDPLPTVCSLVAAASAAMEVCPHIADAAVLQLVERAVRHTLQASAHGRETRNCCLQLTVNA